MDSHSEQFDSNGMNYPSELVVAEGEAFEQLTRTTAIWHSLVHVAFPMDKIHAADKTLSTIRSTNENIVKRPHSTINNRTNRRRDKTVRCCYTSKRSSSVLSSELCVCRNETRCIGCSGSMLAAFVSSIHSPSGCCSNRIVRPFRSQRASKRN